MADVFRKFWDRIKIAGALVVLFGSALLADQSEAQTVTPNASTDAGRHAALLATGKRIYRLGIDGQGKPISAHAPAGLVIEGKDAACVNCHRRSGYGGSEGKYNIRPVTGPALFADQTVVEHVPRIRAQIGTRLRPAYTPESLARAVRTGVDASGKPLEPVMPRFQLSDRDMAALTAYLETLSASDSPGVGEEEIHFATVIQPGVPEERRRAMLEIMQVFVKDKVANMRSNEQRREAGVMRMNRSYRKWVLHVWELSGASETWDAQLQTYYEKQAVFALVGGLGNASWGPIHAFAERLEIPSLFAQVDLPQLAGENNYNVYFSRGLTLDAEVLANFLSEPSDAAPAILQIYRANEAGRTVSAAFKAALPSSMAVKDLLLTGAPDDAFWSRVMADKPSTLVLWLDNADLETLPASLRTVIPVYGSFNLSGIKLPGALNAGSEAVCNLRLVYASDLSPRHESRLLRAKVWLHSKGIALTDEVTQVNTLFAVAVVSDVLGHIMDSFSRDYFIERLEHTVSQTPTPSIYQSVSLGPGQRFAAKGSSIVQWGDKGPAKSVSTWVVP